VSARAERLRAGVPIAVGAVAAVTAATGTAAAEAQLSVGVAARVPHRPDPDASPQLARVRDDPAPVVGAVPRTAAVRAAAVEMIGRS
jgi:hypothetical protein